MKRIGEGWDMEDNLNHNIIGALEDEAQKRESFLDQLASIIKSNLSKNEVIEDEEN